MNAPEHAIQIWLDGSDIKVLYNDAGIKHTVTIAGRTLGIADDVDMRGWMVLTRLLRDRGATAAPARIAEAASITQFQLDRMVKEFGGQVKVVGKKRSLSDMTLEDLGL